VTRHLVLVVLAIVQAAPVAAEPDPATQVNAAVARWELACETPTDLGDCTRTRTIAVAHHCAPETRDIAVLRRMGPARAAQAVLMAALAALEKRTDIAEPAVAAAVLRARTALAEAAYEDFLRLRFPTALDFSDRRKADSQKRFTAFLDDARKKLEAAEAAYQRVAHHPGVVPLLRLRALARTGQLNARFADLLRTAEIPRDVRTGAFAVDKIAAFCDAIVEASEVHAGRASAAFEECRAMAGGQPPWAAACASP
jgi:hypothetical protein